MNRKTKLRLGLSIAGLFFVLTAALCLHIYTVTKPGRSAERLVMARIDLKQDIGPTDATKITQWLYAQPGVNHVLCNDESGIVVFTYSTATNDANKIVAAFKDATGYQAERYLPDEHDMKTGCPVNYGSTMSRISSFFKG